MEKTINGAERKPIKGTGRKKLGNESKKQYIKFIKNIKNISTYIKMVGLLEQKVNLVNQVFVNPNSDGRLMIKKVKKNSRKVWLI